MPAQGHRTATMSEDDSRQDGADPSERPADKPRRSWLDRIGAETASMVRRSVDAFVNGDAELARTVIQDDDKVDDLYMTIYRELLRAMLVDPLCIERASHLILVIKNWERIADQATNIAEEVLFILEGVNVKHAYLSSRTQA